MSNFPKKLKPHFAKEKLILKGKKYDNKKLLIELNRIAKQNEKIIKKFAVKL